MHAVLSNHTCCIKKSPTPHCPCFGKTKTTLEQTKQLKFIIIKRVAKIAFTYMQIFFLCTGFALFTHLLYIHISSSYLWSPTRSFRGPADLCPAHGAPYPVTAIFFLDNNLTLGAVHGLAILNQLLNVVKKRDMNSERK